MKPPTTKHFSPSCFSCIVTFLLISFPVAAIRNCSSSILFLSFRSSIWTSNYLAMFRRRLLPLFSESKQSSLCLYCFYPEDGSKKLCETSVTNHWLALGHTVKYNLPQQRWEVIMMASSYKKLNSSLWTGGWLFLSSDLRTYVFVLRMSIVTTNWLIIQTVCNLILNPHGKLYVLESRLPISNFLFACVTSIIYFKRISKIAKSDE
jgi:hypothetical protein